MNPGFLRSFVVLMIPWCNELLQSCPILLKWLKTDSSKSCKMQILQNTKFPENSANCKFFVKV